PSVRSCGWSRQTQPSPRPTLRAQQHTPALSSEKPSLALPLPFTTHMGAVRTDADPKPWLGRSSTPAACKGRRRRRDAARPRPARRARRGSARAARASQRDGSTRSAPGSSEPTPTRSAHAPAPSTDLIGRDVLVELALVDEDAPRLRAFIAADDAAPLEHVDQPAGAGVADAQAALQERHGGGLRLDDDLDRLVEQRILVGVELAVAVGVLGLGEDLRQLEVALVELLLPLPRLLDDERDLFLGDVRTLDALQAGRAERLEEHVAL